MSSVVWMASTCNEAPAQFCKHAADDGMSHAHIEDAIFPNDTRLVGFFEQLFEPTYTWPADAFQHGPRGLLPVCPGSFQPLIGTLGLAVDEQFDRFKLRAGRFSGSGIGKVEFVGGAPEFLEVLI
jgi:hypothetical protein